MQITIEFKDADQIAALAHIAEFMDVSRKEDIDKMEGFYPLNVISPMAYLMEVFDDVLNYIDSPYAVSDALGKEAGILAYRMQGIGQRILDMKLEGKQKTED